MTTTTPGPAGPRIAIVPWVRLRQQWRRTRSLLRRQPRTRRAVILAGLLVTLLFGRLAIIGVAHVQVGDVFGVENGTTGTGLPGYGPGTLYDFGVLISNRSTDRMVTLRSISLPNGLPAHVRLLRVVYALNGGTVLNLGWPIPAGVITAPLNGVRVPPGKGTSIVLVLVPDRPGIYIIGPVTVHAEVDGPLWSTVQVSHTFQQYVELCPGQTEAACNAGARGVPSVAAGTIGYKYSPPVWQLMRGG